MASAEQLTVRIGMDDVLKRLVSPEKGQLIILSDGTSHGTRVLDDKLDIVRGVKSAKWEIDTDSPSKFATVKLELIDVPVVLVGKHTGADS